MPRPRGPPWVLVADRLQKILSAAGITSRRRAEALITAGRVTVNGRVVRALGTRADPSRDAVAVDGERVRIAAERRTILLHKPRGVVSTRDDPEGRPTVMALVGEAARGLYPVGRLDVNTTGLLLLTDDGALAAGLLHPRSAVARVYHAKVRGTPSAETLTRMRRGLPLADEPGRPKTSPARVRVLERLPTKSWLEITVREGRTRLVRRLCEAAGHPAEKLARVRLGPLGLGRVPLGSWRVLGTRELAALHVAARLSGDASAAARRRGRDTRSRRSRAPRAARGRAAAHGGASAPAGGRNVPRHPAPRRRRP